MNQSSRFTEVNGRAEPRLNQQNPKNKKYPISIHLVEMSFLRRKRAAHTTNEPKTGPDQSAALVQTKHPHTKKNVP